MPEPFPPIGMSPSVWGPILWMTMHIVTLGYSDVPTEQEKKAAIEFFESLVYMIPCPICKEHYKMNIEKFPVDAAVGSRNDLANWVFMIHNTVNEQLGKPKITMQQFIKNLTLLSNQAKTTFPQQQPVPTHSLPLLTGLGLLAGIGIGAAGLYYYQKSK